MAQAVFPQKIPFVFYPVLLVCVVFASFSSCLSNHFVNWDDGEFLLDNPLVKDSSFEGLKKIFTSYTYGNYLPLTISSFALEYRAVQFKPFLYHFDNLFIHALNVVAVFFLIRLLSKSTSIAFLTALLFGVHPLRVESVAWVTQRKDVLFSFFYLWGLITYVFYLIGLFKTNGIMEDQYNDLFSLEKRPYIDYHISFGLEKVNNGKNTGLLILTGLFFVLSVFSKPMAVSFPLVLLALDYLFSRKDFGRVILEKAPFFILSAIFVFVTLQGTSSHIIELADVSTHTAGDKLLFVNFAFWSYLGKICIPYPLSCVYPYPSQIGGGWPGWIYATIFLSALGGIVLVRSFKRSKIFVFSIWFFTATIILPLGNIWFGGYWLCDHFSYLPSIGFFYLFSYAVINFFEKFRVSRWIRIFVLVSVAFIWCGMTFNRCLVWKDGETLWSDVISKFPQLAMAYNNRGNIYNQKRDFARALSDYNKALSINDHYARVYNNRGILLMQINQHEAAVRDFDLAIQYNPGFGEAYYNRSIAYLNDGEYQQALLYARKAKALGIAIGKEYLEKLQAKAGHEIQ